MLKSVLLNKLDMSLMLLINTTTKKEVNDIVKHAADNIPQEEKNTKLNTKIKLQKYESIYSEVDKKDLYDLDKLSLDNSHKDLRKRTFESNLENMYDIKSLIYTNCIHDNKVNNISE